MHLYAIREKSSGKFFPETGPGSSRFDFAHSTNKPPRFWHDLKHAKKHLTVWCEGKRFNLAGTITLRHNTARNRADYEIVQFEVTESAIVKEEN